MSLIYNGLIYTKTNGTLTVGTNTKINGNAFVGEPFNRLSFARKVDGYPVTAIGIFSFRETNIVSVFIHNWIEIIGEDAFASCSNLASVEFEKGSSLRELKRGVFYRCVNIKKIVLFEKLEISEIFVFLEDNIDDLYYYGTYDLVLFHAFHNNINHQYYLLKKQIFHLFLISQIIQFF